MANLYQRPGSKSMFAFLQWLRLNVEEWSIWVFFQKINCIYMSGRIGRCVTKLLLASGMSNLISCHKYFLKKKKKDLRNTPVQTQCRPFQHQLSVTVESCTTVPCAQYQEVMGILHCSPLCLQCDGEPFPLRFLLGGRGRIVGGSSVCVRSLERRHVY